MILEYLKLHIKSTENYRQSKNALSEIYIRNLKTNKEKQITVLKEKIENLGLSQCQKEKNTFANF